MNGHDPLCRIARETWCIWPGDRCWQCALIGKVREDERSLVAVERTSLAELNAEYAKGVQAAREAVAGLDGRRQIPLDAALAAIDKLGERP